MYTGMQQWKSATMNHNAISMHSIPVSDLKGIQGWAHKEVCKQIATVYNLLVYAMGTRVSHTAYP